jgi:hypothetical protein
MPCSRIGDHVMTFQPPQQASNISSNFCNESVYGRMNLVVVHGLLRLRDA